MRRSNTMSSLPQPPQQLRRASSAGRNDLYTRKLRVAVYTALNEKAVDEKHPQFRACFRKLFDVCKLFTEDEVAKVGEAAAGITEKLTKVARKNVDNVIDFFVVKTSSAGPTASKQSGKVVAKRKSPRKSVR